uniref:NADH dehydrogenase subunit 6 n=1 Tax=Zanna robusticephalica TaxID=3081104 RepID=UPI002A83B68B|nr:NADH dehydrogenase subunit 6 [Zanna robusticephalica]WOW98863.1 NADH dehydrogenase subunit 6 [Zanna robusticephalica]
MTLIKPMMLMNMIISPMMKHPISMGSMLIFQTTLLCSTQSLTAKSPWYMYIMFITTVGGLLIMFMYMASIASNEIFKFNIKMMLTYMMMMIIISIFMKMEIINMKEMMKKDFKFNTQPMNEMKSTSKFFNFFKMNLTLTTMLIMFLTLISITNISSTFEGPLKKTYV